MSGLIAKPRIVGIIDEEPYHYRTWSGSSSYFFNALSERGLLYRVFGTCPDKRKLYYYKLRSFHPDIRVWRMKYHLNLRLYGERTMIAMREIQQLPAKDYQVILQVGAWYDLPRKTNKITVSYHDGNLYTFINSPYYKDLKDRGFIKRSLNYERQLYKRMDLIFTMSSWLARSFQQDFGISHEKVLPVGAGVNLPFLFNTEKKSYEEPRILFVGKMFERKGGLYLLEAFEKVKKEIHDAQLILIGPDLKNLPDGVTCLGFVSKNADEGIQILLSEYFKASVFVLPTLYEPYGIVFAEAMAHRLPCIGTDTCAIPEIIENGKSGFIVPVADSKKLADKIIEILRSANLAKQMGEHGYQRYLNNHTWGSVAGKIDEALQNIM